MNDSASIAQSTLEQAASIYAALTTNFGVPLFILCMMAWLIFYLLRKAQAKGLSIEQMFQDSTGKASSARVMTFGAWAVSSWYVAVGRLSGNPNADEFKVYLYVWGVLLIAHKGFDVAGTVFGKKE
jgi:hypothetical protein